MALLILALLQRIFLMSSLMLLLVRLIFFMVLIKLLPILGTISGKTVQLVALALMELGNTRPAGHPPNCLVSGLPPAAPARASVRLPPLRAPVLRTTLRGWRRCTA